MRDGRYLQGLNSITGSGVHVHFVFQGCRFARDRLSMLDILWQTELQCYVLLCIRCAERSPSTLSAFDVDANDDVSRQNTQPH